MDDEVPAQRNDHCQDPSPKPTSEVRYPAVRTISAVCRLLAFLALAAGVIIAGMGIILKAGGLLFSILTLLGSLGGFVLLLAVAEGFRIVVDIEANTRATREHLASKIGVDV